MYKQELVCAIEGINYILNYYNFPEYITCSNENFGYYPHRDVNVCNRYNYRIYWVGYDKAYRFDKKSLLQTLIYILNE